VVVAARVQPKSRRPGLHGVKPGADGPRLQIAVSEAAEHGGANRAACLLLARALGVAPSVVSVRSGAASRLKQLQVTGEPAVLSARLQAL
jgi:uncharacterized protein YggU (UPF0235/DUF167 family)